MPANDDEIVVNGSRPKKKEISHETPWVAIAPFDLADLGAVDFGNFQDFNAALASAFLLANQSMSAVYKQNAEGKWEIVVTATKDGWFDTDGDRQWDDNEVFLSEGGRAQNTFATEQEAINFAGSYTPGSQAVDPPPPDTTII
jgi:hypothetical protein